MDGEDDSVDTIALFNGGTGSSSWMIGVLMALAGTLISALGNHLIVKSHAKKVEPALAQVYFWTGNVCVVVLGTSLGIAALAYAPQSLISPLGGLTIVWNLVLAALPWFGNVRPRSVEVLATVITLVGTMVIVALGPENSGRKSSFWTFLEPSFLMLVAAYSSIGAVLETARTRNRVYARIAGGAMGGLIGGMSNVFAKSAIDFYSGNQVQEEQKDMYTFILVVSVALSLAAVQLLFLNTALANFPVTQVVPIYQTSLVIAATVSGGVAFDEFSEFSLLQYMGFATGVTMSVVGVALLASLGGSSVASTTDESKD